MTQFICTECYRTNMVFEDNNRTTPQFKEKKLVCTTCNKHTDQICVGDKTVAKGLLEATAYKDPKEEKAYQYIKASQNRGI